MEKNEYRDYVDETELSINDLINPKIKGLIHYASIGKERETESLYDKDGNLINKKYV